MLCKGVNVNMNWNLYRQNQNIKDINIYGPYLNKYNCLYEVETEDQGPNVLSIQ